MSQVESEISWDKHESTVSSVGAETLYDKCLALARNLWWSWQPEVINLFRDLDPIRWRQLDHNPIALLPEFTPERLEMRAAELVLYSRINHAYRRLKEYCPSVPPWASHPRRRARARSRWPISRSSSASTSRCRSTPAAWACLSGDHIKSASGLGVPLVAIGLFYDQGYFKQHLDMQRLAARRISRHEGREPADGAGPGPDGKPITVSIDTRTGQAAGQGLADAASAGSTCTCWTATWRATAPRTAS